MTDLRWNRAVLAPRLAIAWPEGVRAHDGAVAPALTERRTLRFLKAIGIGLDPTFWAEIYGIESFQITYSKSTARFVGPPTRTPRWRSTVIVGLTPNTDASYFRRPLDGLPPECFRGL